MGINRLDLELLIQLRQRGDIPLNPCVIELGAQQLSNNFLRSEALVRTAEAAFGAAQPYSLPAPMPSTTSARHGELLASDAPFARDFWISLGFEYSAIDVDGSPGSVPLDLNYDQVPDEMRGKYGLVTNFGTTEHVCNQMNAFKVMHDLAAPGAVMIHHLPAGGSLNHGLVNYTPKFFWYLARSNDYKWLHMNFYASGKGYPVAENIIEITRSYAPESSEILQKHELTDYGLVVALQKTLDIPFVAPIDIETGTRSNNTAFNRRYWTVLQPEMLEAARQGGERPPALAALLTQEDAAATRDREIRNALQRLPGRRFLAFTVAVSALSAAILTAVLVFGMKALFF